MLDLQDLRLRERFQELDLRHWLNENSAVTTIGAVVLLMIALGVMLATLTGGGGGDDDYEAPTARFFYDLNTGELFSVPLTELPPVDRGEPFKLPNGQTMPAGVEAVVLAADGAPEDQYVIGWVETLRPERRAELLASLESEADAPQAVREIELEILHESFYSERLVMDPNDPDRRFVPRFSEAGERIIRRALEPGDGEPMSPVFPD